jgi:sterol desaturase/sphingolipid hydroxylase (fatty acid hydroxylase superfamily)
MNGTEFIPYRNLMLQQFGGSLAVAVAGAAIMPLTWIDAAAFAAGAIFEYWGPLVRNRTFRVADLRELPAGSRPERPWAVVLGAFLEPRTASLLLGVVIGVFLPFFTAVAGGLALGLAGASLRDRRLALRLENEALLRILVVNSWPWYMPRLRHRETWYRSARVDSRLAPTT